MFRFRAITPRPSGIRLNSTHREDFSSPVWRNSIMFGILSYATYKFDQSYASSHEGQGYFSSLIDYYRPQEGLWEARNIRHFEQVSEAAQDTLLIQSASRPQIRALRYPAALDHGSPWNRRVDQRVDTRGVEVVNDAEVAET